MMMMMMMMAVCCKWSRDKSSNKIYTCTRNAGLKRHAT